MRTNEVLDFLYCLGSQYDISEADMRLLCTQLGVDYRDLLNHSI
jgi:hypothetical protein